MQRLVERVATRNYGSIQCESLNLASQDASSLRALQTKWDKLSV